MFEFTVNDSVYAVDVEADTPSAVGSARPFAVAGYEIWLWCGSLWRLYGAPRWQRHSQLCAAN